MRESEPKQKNLNDRNARRYFIQLGNLNFGDDPDALHVSATYSPKYLPATVEDAEREATNYLRRISYRREKEGLPPEIDAAFPDYSIYPECDYAIGYLTRGCPNHCPWCVVPEKEGGIKPYREWKQVVRPDTNKLVLMDNNILASEYGVSQLESMIGSGYAIDLNQGMDARLVNDRIAGILARLTWIRFIRFSCDQIPQIEAIERAAELLGNHGKKPYNLFIYLLVTEDVENAAYRVERLKRLKGISIYAQPERNERKGIIPNARQKEFAQRFIYGRSYLKESWSEYLARHKERRLHEWSGTT